ncbi:hypothetical protein D9611_012377 [Ephemerocybe angulata]|uniref:Uncharacterized protein n=1 Tax=Ephemerocybe angulata TaxID=980116 RepID=A0A8H5CDV5_9AGAR|nr:hypothetical protein D9611_012377 [Tulosesus angulatus]
MQHAYHDDASTNAGVNDGHRSKTPSMPNEFIPPPAAEPSTGQAPFTSVSEAAKLARERAEQKQRDDTRFQNAFNVNKPPGTGSSSKTKTKAGAQGGKRKNDGNDSAVPNKKTNKSGSASARVFKKGEQITALFTLVHGTDAVDEGGLEQPSVASMRVLQKIRQVVYITINVGMTPYDIDYAVRTGFSRCPLVKNATEADPLCDPIRGWRLLVPVPQGKGGRQLLEPLVDGVGGSVEFHDILGARIAAHRQAKAEFKNLVYIALSAGSGDIPVDGLSQYSKKRKEEPMADSDSDGSDNDTTGDRADSSSDNDDDTHNDLNNNSNNKPKSKKPASTKARRNPPSYDDESVGDFLHSSSLNTAYRLTVNVHPSAPGPKTSVWRTDSSYQWPPTTMYPYSKPHQKLVQFNEALDSLTTGTTFLGPDASTLLFPAINAFLPSLGFILELDETSHSAQATANGLDPGVGDEFDAVFRLGPHGLHPIISSMHRAYLVIQKAAAGSPTDMSNELNKMIDAMEPYGKAILNLVLVFRGRYGAKRSLYDPPGFSHFRSVLQLKAPYFAEAQPTEVLSVLQLNISTSSLDDFKLALTNDFGSLDDHLKMVDRKLLVGRFGMQGMLEEIFDPLLDDMDLDHPLYYPLFNMLEAFASALARKLTNWTKVWISYFVKSQSKAKMQNNPNPGVSEKPGSTRNTRSSSSGTNDDDDEEIEWGSHKFEFKFEPREPTPQLSDHEVPETLFPKKGSSYPSVDPQYRKEHLGSNPNTSSGSSSSNGPPPPPNPKPKPKPKKKVPPQLRSTPFNTDTESVESIIAELLKTPLLPMIRLYQRILQLLPAPSRRKQWADFEGMDEPHIWKQMMLIYHPDKNTDVPEQLKQLYLEVVQLIGSRRN